MAISKVPQIRGYTLANSVPYGLSLSSAYSSSPSKLTIDFVNENGNYSLPNLNFNSRFAITFGSFKFIGSLFGYNLKEAASENVIQVEFIDGSVILDQFYVVLWKRGFFNNNGQEENALIDVNLSEETYLVPIFDGTSFPYTKYQERSLPNQRISRPRRYIRGSTRGNIIYLGKENTPQSVCEIPDTYYTFNDLKGLLPFNFIGAPSDDNLIGTYEGTLRSVLNSWCGDLGYDYFWDYSSNRLVFYKVDRGIPLRVPNFNKNQIISQERSASLAGTYRQYGASFVAKPKEPLRTVSFTTSYSTGRSVSPIHLSYLIRRNEIPQNLDDSKDDKEVWGSGRNQNEFLACAFLGYISEGLRTLYCLQKGYHESLGYKTALEFIERVEKKELISALAANGLEESINELKALNDKDLSNYDFAFTYFDESFGQAWNDIEQKMLQSIGKYYRTPDSSGSFFFCTSNVVAEINVSVDPEGANELIGSDEKGVVRKVFSRDNAMSHSADQILEQLNYDNIAKNISQCMPYHLGLKENGMLQKLKAQGFTIAPEVTHLIIIPNYEKFSKKLCPVNITVNSGSNPQEKTWNDLKNSNVKDGRKNCTKLEERLKNSCLTAQDEAKNIAFKSLGLDDDKDPDNLVSGLTSRIAKKATIKLKDSSAQLFAPSDSPYKVVCNYSINSTVISNRSQNQLISFNTNAPSNALMDISEIRFTLINETNSEDKFSVTRKKFIPIPSIVATAPQRNEKYVIAGEPNGNLSPEDGLSAIDVSLSSDGFTTTLTYSSRPPSLVRSDNTLRQVNSQLNRVTFNAS